MLVVSTLSHSISIPSHLHALVKLHESHMQHPRIKYIRESRRSGLGTHYRNKKYLVKLLYFYNVSFLRHCTITDRFKVLSLGTVVETVYSNLYTVLRFVEIVYSNYIINLFKAIKLLLAVFISMVPMKVSYLQNLYLF